MQCEIGYLREFGVPSTKIQVIPTTSSKLALITAYNVKMDISFDRQADSLETNLTVNGKTPSLAPPFFLCESTFHFVVRVSL